MSEPGLSERAVGAFSQPPAVVLPKRTYPILALAGKRGSGHFRFDATALNR
jgi:hypothetical protein